MKKTLLITILLLLHWGQEGFCQGDFTRIYHPIINEAELAIVDTNYYEALDFYKEAFANVRNPFAKDYYNAAICAAMAGKLPLTLEYLEKIVEKGYPSDSLRKDIFFHYVADTCKRWTAFEKQMKLVKPNINWELRDSLKSYYTLVTKVVHTPLTPELRAFFNENFKKRQDTLTVAGKKEVFTQVIFPDSLYYFGDLPQNLKIQQDSLKKINYAKYAVNSKIAFQKTLGLIEMNGFPDETLIGLSGFDGRFTKVYRNALLYEQSLNVSGFDKNLTINILSSSLSTQGQEILPVLIQAIRDGKLIPHQINRINFSKLDTNTKNLENELRYAIMGRVQTLQLQLETNLVCKNSAGIANKKFWKKEPLSNYSEAEINEKRTDIGLEKLADAYKKAFFKANPTPFIINGGSYQKELSYISSCEVLEKVLKENVLLR